MATARLHLNVLLSIGLNKSHGERVVASVTTTASLPCLPTPSEELVHKDRASTTLNKKN